MVRKRRQITMLSEPLEFFRNLVITAIENQKVLIKKDTEYYLVALLAKYMQSDSMKYSGQDPLAIQLHKAMLAKKVESIQILKELGDFALYISGFFSDSLNRKLVDIDYYMAMGGIAYRNLAYVLTQESLQELYKDLYIRFGTCVDILSEISEKAFLQTNRDLLRTYEKWLKTRSERLEILLKKEGLFPIPNLHKKIQ